MVELARGWLADIERGPDWLFVRLQKPEFAADDAPPLADSVWELLEQHFVHRVVVEMDQIEWLQSYLVGQLVLLHRRATQHGGIVRLSGLSPANRDILAGLRLENRFPYYANRDDAVLGYLPKQPR
ncbi:MAG: STAS domain-containing protein [Pirellulales bacterium]|nr:STAS domain-containing protein [Pirellulales bacterium]